MQSSVVNVEPARRFTRREVGIAINVLSHSQFVLNWCKGEAEAYGIQQNTPKYDEFVRIESRKYAKKLLQ